MLVLCSMLEQEPLKQISQGMFSIVVWSILVKTDFFRTTQERQSLTAGVVSSKSYSLEFDFNNRVCFIVWCPQGGTCLRQKKNCKISTTVTLCL